MQLHEFVETSESVTEGSVLDPLFVRYHIVVKSLQRWQRVHHEVSVTRNCTDGIREEGDMHYLWKNDKRLQVLPLRNLIVMQVQELEAFHASEYLSCGQRFQLVIRQVNFL